MIKFWDPPASVPCVVIVEPCSVLSAPDKVTAPEYVCVPVVVTFAPKSVVPLTANTATWVMAPFKSKLPVIVKFCAPLTATVWIVEPAKVLAAVPKVIAAE